MKVIGSEELEKKEGRDLVFGKRKEKKKKSGRLKEREREQKTRERVGEGGNLVRILMWREALIINS